MPRGGRRSGGTPQLITDWLRAKQHNSLWPCAECGWLSPARELVRHAPKAGIAWTLCSDCWVVVAARVAPRLADAKRLDAYYRQTYGITLQDYGRMYLRQHGR